MKNPKLIFLFLSLTTLTCSVLSQTYTDTIYVAADGIDAEVNDNNTTTNYGTLSSFRCQYDTRSPATLFRTFIQVDLSSIPVNAIVTSASLVMYAQTVYNESNHPMKINRVLSSWSETGITWANQPSVTSTGASSITHAQTSSTGWQTLGITTLAQHAINFPATNYGWRINLETEPGATRNGVSYRSSEHGTSSDRPYVVINYILPVEVEGIVSHCTSGNDDGSVVASYSGGSGTYASYEWFHYDMGTVSSIESGSTMSNIDIDNLEDGLYLLTVVDNLGYRGYKYFLVGEYGTSTTVDFRNNNNTANSVLFNEDATPYYLVGSANGTSLTGNQSVLYAYNSTSLYYSALLNYKVDFDSLFDVSQADLRLYSMGHYRNSSPATTDSGYVSRVISEWYEPIVNWDTKPTKTSSDRQLIPPTNPAGTVTRHDTINLLPFVEYWQQNPDENYGIDISLTQYAQPANAYLRYRSYDYGTASQRPSFLVTFSLPEQITTEFNDSSETGNILVYAPGYGGKYHYFISDVDTLPDYDTIWYALKDTLIGFGVDSVDFYTNGNEGRSYSFTDLQEGKYFVGIYDWNGNKVLDKQVFIRSPFRLVDSTDISIVAGGTIKVKSPATMARVKVMGVTNIDESGGIEFKVTSLADDFVFGFNKATDPAIIFDNNFEYAFRISRSGDLEILKNGFPLDSFNVSILDRLKIYKEVNQIVFSKNDIELLRDTLHQDSLYATKTEIFLKGENAEVTLVSYYGKKKPKTPIRIKHPICGTINGSINISVMGSYFGYNMDSYYLDNLNTSEYFSGAAPGIISNVPSGTYMLQIIWTNGFTSFSTYQYVYVGHPLIWIQPGTNMTVLSNNAIIPSVPTTNSEISAVNITDPDGLNWVQFTHSSTSIISITKIALVNTSDEESVELYVVAFGMNKWATVYSNGVLQNAEVISSLYPLAYGGQIVSIPNNQPFRIEENNGLVTIFHSQTMLLDYNSSVTGALTPLVTIMGNAQVSDAVASFCYPKTPQYIKLRRTLDGGYYLAQNNTIYVEYDEEYNDGELKFRVYSESDLIEESNSSMIVDAISYGDNRLVFEFSSTTGDCISDGYYILEITNGKSEKLYLRFKITDSPC